MKTSTAQTLEEERNRVSFDVVALSEWWVGGKDKLLSQIKVSKAVEADQDFNDFKPSDIYRLSKKERYTRAAELFKLVREKTTNGDLLKPPYNLQNKYEFHYFSSLAHVPDANTMGITYAMFIPTLRNQTSAEQKAMWLPAAETLAITGCYGQTEIAHGSDVRSLETEARYDPASKTFDLHTPNIGAIKWWPASLGRTATHGIIHARLLLPKVINGKRATEQFDDYGVKPFFVQLRDLDTHENLPGIESGDIGPTMGIVAMEEGWCSFNHVTLPRISLLARYGHVSEDGDWVPPPPRFGKRAYATMLLVRSGMVVASSDHLGKACTISIRYCTARRQFRKLGSDIETQVLDYPQVAMRTLPWVSTAYALKVTGRVMKKMHREMEDRVENITDDVAADMEAEVHALASCLKAVCTTFAVDGIEELRRVCGGHGYSMYSGFQDLYGSAMVNFTGEGENYMLIQQASRSLLKFYRKVEKGEKLDSPYFQFIKTASELDKIKPIGSDVEFSSVQLAVLVEAFEHRAGRLLVETTLAAEDGVAPLQDSAQWEGIKAAWAYGEYLILKSFVEGINKEMNENVKQTLTLLCQLFAVDLMNKKLQDFLMDGYFSPENCANIRKSLKLLLKQVRPLAIGLVDSMHFQDRQLNSAIGMYEGNVYETLLSWAKKDPMNEGSVIEGYHSHYGAVVRAGRELYHKKTGKRVEDVDGIVQCKKTISARM